MDFIVSYIETWTMCDGTGEELSYEHDKLYTADGDCHDLAIFVKAFSTCFSSVMVRR